MSAAFGIDMCTCAEAYRVIGASVCQRPFREAPLPAFARCAISNAVMLAIEPPLVSRPRASLSYPIKEPSQRTTVRSISVAAGPDRQDVTFAFSADAIRSANAPAGVAGDATYPKKRGWPL